MLKFMGSQRVGHDRATQLNFTELVITFVLRSKRLLISWLRSPSAVILEPKKIKSVTVSIVSPYICHEVLDWSGGLPQSRRLEECGDHRKRGVDCIKHC